MPLWLRLYAPGPMLASRTMALGPGPVPASPAVDLGPELVLASCAVAVALGPGASAGHSGWGCVFRHSLNSGDWFQPVRLWLQALGSVLASLAGVKALGPWGWPGGRGRGLSRSTRLL